MSELLPLTSQEEDARRFQILHEAYAANKGLWPDELYSGVMFYRGARITRKEFEKLGEQS